MILPEHLPHFARLRDLGAFRAPMLLLGPAEAAADAAGVSGVEEVLSLDDDLCGDLTEHHGRFGTVLDLGAIEHCWDTQAAWSNAARLVATGGALVVHAAVGGWERHGAHVTDERFIRAFLLLNGFRIAAHWLAFRDGRPCESICRDGGSVTLWLLAVKEKAVRKFAAPQQAFENGAPVWIGGRDARGRLVTVA